MDAAVRLENVRKTFGEQVAVDALTLQVPEASVYGFIGPNGSGKTTTLRIITRIYLPDSGRVSVLGEDNRGPNNDHVSYLPEERSIYKNLRVREAVRFYGRLKGHRPTRGEIDEWLERVDLTAHQDKKVQQLSKGMNQKLQFVCAAVSNPKLVLLDEPFSGLDPVNAQVLREMIGVMRQRGTTVIFSTHDMRIAEQMCDYIFMIHQGKKVLDGTLAEIRATYGKDVIHVRMTPANGSMLAQLPGVAAVSDLGNYAELRLQPGADPQKILLELASRGSVEHFEVASPNLQDIFVRIAAPDRQALATMG